MQIKYNISPRTQKIKYIVIHDTGNKTKGANAYTHFKYFSNGNRSSSADFFVDSKETLQINDYRKYYTWHCGDGRGKYGITNNNSIGIELCINEDGDYTTAYNNTITLTKYLMSVLNIDIDHVVRHYDASCKLCPRSMSDKNWSKWYEFKNKLIGAEKVQEITSVNDIVWELSQRQIITDKAYWLEELSKKNNNYYLAKNMINYLSQKGL